VEIFESYLSQRKSPKTGPGSARYHHDGNLTAGERQNARIIIYGPSRGGSEAIKLARDLEKDSIPVLLTVQVDSISIRHNDRVIRRMWPRLRISISRMGFSAAGRRSALPIQPARGSSVIFGPTTKRVITTANTIPGMTASS
jgi:hypothetical protein